MDIKISVVAKKNNKWYIGFIDGSKFNKTKEIKKLNDVKEVTNYKTFKKYLKDNKLSPNIEKEILDKLELQNIYILDKPIEPSDEEFEVWWWKNYNKECIKCEESCKQSDKVIIVKCKNIKKGKIIHGS